VELDPLSVFGILRIPLFVRRLYIWGFFCLTLWIVNLIAPAIVGNDESTLVKIVMLLIMSAFQIWFGLKGNEMTAKNYLEQGWQLAEPGSEATSLARGKWGIIGREPNLSTPG